MALTKNDLQAIQGLLQPVHARLDKMDARLDRMDARMDKMDIRMDGMDSRFDRIENKLDKVDSEVSALKSGQLEMRKELKEVNRKVSVTYELALDAWGTSMENRGWLERESGFSSNGFGDGKAQMK